MNQVKSKAYYDIETGNVLIITGEYQGDVINTTKEQDMQIYAQLKDKSIDELDYIELEYGALTNIVNGAKEYKVNLDNKQLEVTYYTEEELNIIQKQNKELQDLDSRISDISIYLSNSDKITVTNIEDSILQIEQNKIVNGGI